MIKDEVSLAIDILLTEIEQAIEKLKNEGSQAFLDGRYQVVKSLLKRAL